MAIFLLGDDNDLPAGTEVADLIDAAGGAGSLNGPGGGALLASVTFAITGISISVRFQTDGEPTLTGTNTLSPDYFLL